jgi:hypothetical protein
VPAPRHADSHSPNPPIIPDNRGPGWPARFGVSALVLGSVVAWWYARAGLTLSHYDAKAHLVVARRIADSLTPGWMQIGAVWLPLPHLVSSLPVQWDGFYRTGAFGVALSVVCFAATIYLLARMLAGLTHSPLGALAGALTFGLNPNVLYLQSTPMTEPLLMALTALATWLGIDAFRTGDARGIRRAGLALAGAALTRYEAWPFCSASSRRCARGGPSASPSCSPAGWRPTRLRLCWRSPC